INLAALNYESQNGTLPAGSGPLFITLFPYFEQSNTSDKVVPVPPLPSVLLVLLGQAALYNTQKAAYDAAVAQNPPYYILNAKILTCPANDQGTPVVMVAACQENTYSSGSATNSLSGHVDYAGNGGCYQSATGAGQDSTKRYYGPYSTN